MNCFSQDDLTDCPVCFRKYDRDQRVPRKLPQCTHSFCSMCINSMMKPNSIQCPSCRSQASLTSAHELEINFSLLQLPDQNVSPPQVSENLSNFPRVTPPDVNAGVCEEHREYKLFRCTTCAQYICHVCTIVEHPYQTCKVITIKEALTVLKVAKKIDISSELCKCDQVRDDLEQYNQQVDVQIKAHNDHIHELQALVDDHNTLVGQLQQEKDKIRKALEENQQNIDPLNKVLECLNLLGESRQEIEEAATEAQRCIETAGEWTCACTQQFPDLTLISSSIKVSVFFQLRLLHFPNILVLCSKVSDFLLL